MRRPIRISAAIIVFIAALSCQGRGSCSRMIGSSDIYNIRGVTLMDDSTLWDVNSVIPMKDSIEERDWALAAVGDINVVRLALKMDYFIEPDGKPRREGFAFLNGQLVFANKYDLGVILDMHVPPGGAVQDYRVGPETIAFWEDTKLMDLFVKCWETIAEPYSNDARILAYELMNEPSGPPEEYWKLMERTARAIRKVDDAHAIIVQPDREWTVRKIDVPEVAYSFHFYDPIDFTHQGVKWDPEFRAISDLKYPGNARGTDGEIGFYDREKIKSLLTYPARASRELDAPVIIGEFAVSTSADEESSKRWISDVIDASEELGLMGYVYWRQADRGGEEIAKSGQATMAVINDGCYASRAQFFSIRPSFEKTNPEFDFASFYWDFDGSAAIKQHCRDAIH